MANQWFISKDGENKTGPFTESELSNLAKDGQIKPTDLVGREGLPDWTPASKLRWLFPEKPMEAVPPPQNPAAVAGPDTESNRTPRRAPEFAKDAASSGSGYAWIAAALCGVVCFGIIGWLGYTREPVHAVIDAEAVRPALPPGPATVSAIALIHGVGSIGLFATRAFLPAFITALLIRFGPEWGIVGTGGLFRTVEGAPSWFTHDYTIGLLGVLAALEIAASKSPAAREILDGFDQYLKAAVAVLTQLGVLNAMDVQFVKDAMALAGVHDYVFAAIIPAGVAFVGGVRNEVMEFLREIDDDDDFGLQRLLSWLEDLWAGFGAVVLIVFPLLMFCLLAGAMGLLYVTQKAIRRAEENNRINCPKCGEMAYRCALNCPTCGESLPRPTEVGWLGQSTTTPAIDREEHAFRLIEKKRCPVCASHLDEHRAVQKCGQCGHVVMDDPKIADVYVRRIDKRVPTTLAICLGLSFVPVIGLIPGVLFYRTRIVSPYRCYLPRTSRFRLRWLVRLCCLLLIAIQWVPFLGAVTLPLMALLNWSVYRSAYTSQLASQTDQSRRP